MNKKTKILVITNFILWIIAMTLILLGAVFVFIAGKGYGDKGNIKDAKQLIDIGNQGSIAVGGILIAIAVGILATAIVFFALKLNKESKKIITTSFITTLIISILMTVMAILDIARVWSIWPWLINFGCLLNFVFVVLAFKTLSTNKISKSESIMQIEALNENGILTKEEYKVIKERAKRILKVDNKETPIINNKEEVEQKVKPEEIVKKEVKEEVQKPKTEKEIEKEQIKTAKVKVKDAKKEYRASKKQ